MKKVLLTIALAGVSVSLLAQGTIIFNNTGGSGTTAYKFPIYGPEPSNVGLSLTGNTSAGAPPGTQVYTGPLLAGAGFMGQLFAGPAGTSESNLVAALPISTFRTGTAAGYLPTATATIGNVAGDAGAAVVQLRVWDTKGGQFMTWDSASVAWRAGLTAAGVSGLLNFSVLGGAINPPPTLLGLQSFNIYYVPEPTTMALAGLGAAALLIFRRRK